MSGPKNQIRCSEFDIKRYSYTELDTSNERSKTQCISYPRYQYPNQSNPSNLIFQTDFIQIVQYGLPKLSDFIKDDTQREFIKVPFDQKQESCKGLFKMLKAIDEHTEKNSKKYLGKFAAMKTAYTPIVRAPPEMDDDTAAKRKSTEPRMDYCKLKLNTDYNTHELKTSVYIRKEDENGKLISRTVADCSTIEKLEKIGLYNSKIRFIVQASKLWIQRAPDQKTKERSYGVSFKILQMEVVPNERVGSLNEQYTAFAFLDDEQGVGGDEQTTTNNNSALDADNEEEEVEAEEEEEEEAEAEEEEEEEEEEPEPEPEPEPPKPVKKTAAKTRPARK